LDRQLMRAGHNSTGMSGGPGDFQAVAGQLTPEQFQESAMEAFGRMSPAERSQFAQYLQQQGGADPADPAGLTSDDPRQLLRPPHGFRLISQMARPVSLAAVGWRGCWVAVVAVSDDCWTIPVVACCNLLR
jgi:hypothetical protein